MSKDAITSDLNVLRTVSTPVETAEEAKTLFDRLKAVLGATTGLGLSAIQIGVPKRMSIIRNRYNDGFDAIINPVVLEKEEEFVFSGEGCLSFPGVFVSTRRYRDFVIKNHVIDGDSLREETHYFHYEGVGDNVASIVAQHEIDHMNGVLFSDKEVAKVNVQVIGSPKIGRNDPCPCKSGKKYKKCCGSLKS